MRSRFYKIVFLSLFIMFSLYMSGNNNCVSIEVLVGNDAHQCSPLLVQSDTITPSSKQPATEEREGIPPIYTIVEQMPSFPGGELAMQKYIRDNLKIPQVPQEEGIQGSLRARFVVNADGSISDVKIIRPMDTNIEKVYIEMIKSMPTWIPGEHEGKKVAVYYTLAMFVCYR